MGDGRAAGDERGLRLVIRPTDSGGDRAARAEVVRQTWEASYAGIFSHAETERIFSGSLRLEGDWTARRTAQLETLVAELDDRVVGVAGLGLLEPGVGELAALYVLPEWQGRGVGLRLWQAALPELSRLGCSRMEVWTLARAQAWRFYEARGCGRLGNGVLRVGGHTEAVAGYQLSLVPELAG